VVRSVVMPPKNSSQEHANKQKEIYERAVSTRNEAKPTDSPTPVPLRTLTTLLNYERCASDPRFQKSQLVHSTFADQALILRATPELRRLLATKPATIEQIHMHAFCTESDDSGTPSTNDVMSPNAFPAAQALTFAQREFIYHESRGHDGCYKALALYQAFFDLCPLDQQVSIQIKKENPILVTPFLRQIVEFQLKGYDCHRNGGSRWGEDSYHRTGSGEPAFRSWILRPWK
jgi:hypothetical protein